jgi:hypothetical protein
MIASIVAMLDFWDWVTFGLLFSSVLIFLIALVGLLTLPGRIALARKHPDAEAVRTMGLLGFLAVVPWMQAFIWALKPTDKVDIRRFPDEEREANEEEIARLTAERGNLLPEPKPRRKAESRDQPQAPES